MTLLVASEKSGNDRSGIDGNETDGIAGIMSRADFVMASILLGAESSARAAPMPLSSATKINIGFIDAPLPIQGGGIVKRHFRNKVRNQEEAMITFRVAVAPEIGCHTFWR
jgi:hypothetical protein